MRTPLILLLAAPLVCAACGSSEQSRSETGPQAVPTANVASRPSEPSAPAGSSNGTSIAHGAQPPGAQPPGAPGGGPDTSALDKKVEQAEAKAKAAGASAADKTAAAASYVERGNVFYNAGQPTLYKFALRDFRRALRYDPNNAEARAKQDQIVAIYNQMGRPVPDLGNEP